MGREQGFTLIELLVAVTIVGILSAIAIPQYTEYKERSFDARARVDLRSGIVAQETAYIENNEYVSCGGDCSDLLPFLELSQGVSVTFVSDVENFNGTSFHDQGKYTFTYDSAEGVVHAAE